MWAPRRGRTVAARIVLQPFAAPCGGDGVCGNPAASGSSAPPPLRIRPLAARRSLVLIGYMRVSKADNSQELDRQRDALLAAGVDPSRLY